jgi:DNA-directed RNA polymerase sigma subunit (sigma70/sigma32)
VSEDSDQKSIARLMNARGRVKAADAQAAYARRELRRMMRDEIESGRMTPAQIARAFGLSRQRIRQMLTERDS